MLFLHPPHLSEDFWKAPDETLFTERTIAAVTGLTDAWCQRSRWAGQGPPFVRIGRNVRYRKSDVVAWIESQQWVPTKAAELAPVEYRAPATEGA